MAEAVLTFDVERFVYDVRVSRDEGGLGLEGVDVQQWARRATPDFTRRACASARAGAVEKARAAS